LTERYIVEAHDFGTKHCFERADFERGDHRGIELVLRP
jgi:hypothetical protein